MHQRHPEVLPESSLFKFPGRGQRNTPVVGAKGLVTIMNLLQGERAAKFRAAEADVLVRYLGGDLSLIQDVKDIHQAQQQMPAEHPARMFGEHVDEVREKLGGLTETREELSSMVDTAEKLIAMKPELQETSGLLKTFPFQEFGTYLSMRCKEIEIKQQEISIKQQEVGLKQQDCVLDERQLGTKQKRFELTQKEDEHSIRMKRDHGDLDDRSAKRRRYDSDTENGVTITGIVKDMAASAKDPRAFLDTANRIGVYFKVWEKFARDLIPGSYKPRVYKADAADTISATIAQWVADAQPKEQAGIKKYFQAAQQAAEIPETDLYD